MPITDAFFLLMESRRTPMQLDMECHIRHSALPKPGRYRALFALVSRLHGTLLDRSRPMRDTAAIWLGKKSRMSVPFHKIPQSPLSTQLTGARRFVAQSWPIERVRALGKAERGKGRH